MYKEIVWWYSGTLYHLYRHQSRVDSRLYKPKASTLRSVVASYISILMAMNLESIYLGTTKLFVVPSTWKNLNSNILVVVFLAIWLFNHFCISALGGFDQVRKQFDVLPETTQKKQVRAIKIYGAVSIMLFITSIFA